MPGAAVITGGTYLLELSSGYDGEAFYLDQSLLDGPAVLDGDGEDSLSCVFIEKFCHNRVHIPWTE